MPALHLRLCLDRKIPPPLELTLSVPHFAHIRLAMAMRKRSSLPRLDSVLTEGKFIFLIGNLKDLLETRYWASEMDPAAYSFVEYALARGYSTFIYDRLGTGKSTK